MTSYNYAFKTEKENVVKTVGRDLGLSRKKAVEICKFIKGKSVAKAKSLLEKVKDKTIAVPFTRSTNGAGHRKGRMAGGKYPLKGALELIKMLKQLEANAQNKGLSSELKVIHACAQQASEPNRYGRKRRVKMKRCHVELAAQEIEGAKKHKHHDKHAKKDEPAEKKVQAAPVSKPVEKKAPAEKKESSPKKEEAKAEKKSE